MPFKTRKHPYMIVMSVILVAVTLLYCTRVFSIQIVNAERFSADASGLKLRTAVIKAPRGEILDCNGRKIAVNRDGYDVVFNSAYINRDKLNDLILTLIKMCEAEGCGYVNNLDIIFKDGKYEFSEDASPSKIRNFLKLADYATAENCVDNFIQKYSLREFSAEDRLKIMSVRYSMDRMAFSIKTPYTFADDIPSSLMLKISEASYILKGVTVEVVPYRDYVVTDLAPHLIGTIGPIYEEEWDTYKEKGYSYNDKVGKSGIELYAEEYLRGIDGELTYKIDNKGNIVETVVTKEPIAGKTVMLTLDKSLQKTTQDILVSRITDMQSTGSTVTGGAAVVMNVKTGGILSAATYPSYDMATMSKEYESLVKNPNKPLLNRAFQGVYPIGSTIKPVVAIAAMENGKYNGEELIYCSREYKYFSDYQPSCMHFHGRIDLNTALARSCNYFFFELGRRTGVVTLNKYFKNFGLGVKTGVEISDNKGILNEYTSDSGNTIQVAIGQLNAFTPLQLTNYTCALANGGTLYKATLIDRVVSSNFDEIFFTNTKTVMTENNVSPEIMNAVMQGMLSVTEDGTGSTVLGTYPIKIGGKTGTSQVDGKPDHSVFISFAPFNDPEIAVVILLEHGNSTFNVTTIAKAIYDGYFFADEDNTINNLPYTVLQ